MAPTPITSTHRLTVRYTVTGIQRTAHFYVDAFPSILFATGWGITAFTASNRDVGDVADQIANGVKESYSTSATFDDWILEEYVSGAYVFKVAGTIGIAGTGAFADTKGMGFYVVTKDTANKVVKHYFLEANLGIPGKYSTLASLPANFNNFPTDLMDTAAGGLGDVIRSRGNNQVGRFISWVSSTNRKARRRRGIA